MCDHLCRPSLYLVTLNHGSAIFVDQCLKVESVEMEISILYFKTFLGKIECLLYQVGVSVIAQCFVQVLTV